MAIFLSVAGLSFDQAAAGDPVAAGGAEEFVRAHGPGASAGGRRRIRSGVWGGRI